MMPKKQGLDDLGKIAKEAYDAMRGGKKVGKAAKKTVAKKASKAANDIPDPKFPSKKVYDKKGSMTKQYKDYVMRNSKGDY